MTRLHISTRNEVTDSAGQCTTVEDYNSVYQEGHYEKGAMMTLLVDLNFLSYILCCSQTMDMRPVFSSPITNLHM